MHVGFLWNWVWEIRQAQWENAARMNGHWLALAGTPALSRYFCSVWHHLEKCFLSVSQLCICVFLTVVQLYLLLYCLWSSQCKCEWGAGSFSDEVAPAGRKQLTANPKPVLLRQLQRKHSENQTHANQSKIWYKNISPEASTVTPAPEKTVKIRSEI